MIKQRLIFLILILGLAGCVSNEQPAPTPTPFPNSGDSSDGKVTSGHIIPVEIADLTANPQFYEEAYLKVNGRYRQMPTRVCSSTTYPSPAAWGLVSGELIAYMNGLDTQLRTLIPDETTMEVNGIWRQWEGAVGCGKEATVQQIWYLEVREILSPNPLTKITLTPTNPIDGTQIAEAGDEAPQEIMDETPLPGQEETAVPLPTGSDISTPVVTRTPTRAGLNLPTPTSVETAVSTEVGDDGEEGESTPTVTPTLSNSNNSTSTPTPTSTTPGENDDRGTPVPTTPPLSTPTPIPQEVEIDALDSYQLGFELINSSEIHVWTLDLAANDVVTVSVATQPGLNVALSLIDPTGQTVVSQHDLSPAGSVEIMGNIPISMSGEYKLHIQTTENSMGEYVVSIYDNSTSSFPFIYQDVLEYGDSATATLLEEADDYWHFYGNSGDNITITVIPGDANADLFVTLWAETGDIGESDEPAGVTETFTITLPDNGMYSIQVADWDLLEQGYSISLTKNN